MAVAFSQRLTANNCYATDTFYYNSNFKGHKTKKKVLTENRYMCNARNFPVEKKKTFREVLLMPFY